MANDLNLCQFIGRLGRDVETRYLQSGDAVSSFSLAVGSSWKDKNGDKQESTEWVSCVIFGKMAEVAEKYLQKGSQVYVSGRIRTEKYQAKDGADRYSTKIVVDRMQMLGGRQAGGQGDSGERNHAPRSTQEAGGFEDMGDDIPF